MIWNELPYELQQKVINRIVTLLETENNDDMQDGLIAAVHELEVWSNTPCQIQDADENGTFIAYAADPFPEDDHD
jgi:hypothetical protein